MPASHLNASIALVAIALGDNWTKWPSFYRKPPPTCAPSSAGNVGPDKNSDKRQRAAIDSYAKGCRL